MNMYGDLPPRQAAKVVRKFLRRAKATAVTDRFGAIHAHKKNSTDTRVYRRYEPLPVVVAPLSEGVPPAGRKLTYTDVTVKLEQYGDTVNLTDKMFDMDSEESIMETSELLSEQCVEVIEKSRLNRLAAGTNVFYANNVASRSVIASKATAGDFKRITRQLNRARAKKITKVQAATNKVSTEPTRAGFFGLAHTDLEADLRNMSTFIPAEKYPSQSNVQPGEIGSIEGHRIILSDLVPIWEKAGASGTTNLSGGVEVSVAAKADVYPILIFAADAYAVVPFAGKKGAVVSMIRPKPSSGDILGQKGGAGWKKYDAAVILNELWMARLEVAVTADPA